MPDVLISAESLHRFYVACFSALGVPAGQSATCADGLSYADASGIITHGASSLNRLYLRMLRDDEVNGTATPVVLADRQATMLVDGCNGLGFVTAEFAMRQAIYRASQYGVSAVAVRNSSHCGSMGWYTSLAAAEGLVGFAFTNLGAQALLPPPRGLDRLLGTNVLAASAPASSEAPFNLDMSTAVVAAGRLRMARDQGLLVPDGWLIDDHGNPVNEPAAYFDGKARLQFLGGSAKTGGNKGYGLAILADILCGVLTGAAFGPNSSSTSETTTRADAGVGHFFLAVDVTAFRSSREFTAQMDQLLRALRTSTPIDETQSVGYPGLPEHTMRTASPQHVTLPHEVYDELAVVAAELGVDAPQIVATKSPALRASGDRPRSAPLRLRYGLNPHQAGAVAQPVAEELPFTLLNGAPSYLAIMDAIAGWRMVREGRTVLGRPVAASVKHAGPNGVGIDVELSDVEATAYRMPHELSPIALAYVRARGTDRVAAYGDFVALSEAADLSFARAVRGEAINGVIAPAFEPQALAELRRKRGGDLVILQAHSDYEPPAVESRELFGVSLRQCRDEVLVTMDQLRTPLTDRREMSDAVLNDMLLAVVAAHYSQSNAVCIAHRGQTIGIGAGQPSRVRATRLACAQAELWSLRQHPALLEMAFGESLTRHDRDTAIDELLQSRSPRSAEHLRLDASDTAPGFLSPEARSAWLSSMDDLVLASDGPFPFPDSLHVAGDAGVRYIAHSGGARRDANVIATANKLDMVLVAFGNRLFYH